MKELLIEILKKHNNIEDGIFISVDLETYVEKIMDNAKIISIFEFNRLKAFIAYYKNDNKNKNAYLSMILVDKDFQSDGLGRQLLKSAMDDVRNSGYQSFKLEVLKSNKKALDFYLSNNFSIVEDHNNLWLMEVTFLNTKKIFNTNE